MIVLLQKAGEHIGDVTLRHGRVAYVVDDVQPPWRPRFIEIRGTVQAFKEGGKTINESFRPKILRLTLPMLFRLASMTMV